MSDDPVWMTIAREKVGIKEIPGTAHNPLIIEMWKRIGMDWVKNDELAWCAAFVGSSLEEAEIMAPRSGRARDYLQWGKPITTPAIGAVAVLSRPPHPDHGHVGFVAGRTERNWLVLVSGNQNNAVTMAEFDPARVIDYRWPLPVPYPQPGPLPVISGLQLSRSEA